MIPRPDVLIGNLTHVGMERSVNQDYYGYFESENEAEFELLGRLVVVCDGMGGHAGGEVASRLAVNTIIDTYRQDRTGNVLEALRLSIEAANRAVWNEGQAKAELKGMGTTVVSIVLKQGMAYFAHVGDSRCYMVRNNQLHQVTLDHSLVQQMVNEGLLDEAEMENHPEKNVILRSLGVKPDVDVELQYQPYQVDDIFMLSSDGLTGLVSKQECFQYSMMHRDHPMQACAQLVDLANRYGGYDNITVQIARIMAMSVQEGMARQQQMQASQSGPHHPTPMPPPPPPPPREVTPARAPTAEGQKNITGVMNADEVEKIKKEAQAAAKQKAEGGAPAAPPPSVPAKAKTSPGARAHTVPPKGVLPIPIAGAAVGGALVFGLVLGMLLGGGGGGNAALDAKKKEIAGALPRELSTPNKDKLAELLDKLPEIIGSADEASVAQYLQELQDLPEGTERGPTKDEAGNWIKRAEEARDSAKSVGGEKAAAKEFQDAEAKVAEAKTAKEKGDYANTMVLCLRAMQVFGEATQLGRQKLVDDEIGGLESRVKRLLADADSVQAAEHVPELLSQAKGEIEKGRQARKKDVHQAVLHFKVGVAQLQEAVRLAPEIQKKKLNRATKTLADAKAKAVAAGAQSRGASKAAFAEAENLEKVALTQQSTGDLAAAMNSTLSSLELYKSAQTKAESDTRGQQIVVAAQAAAAAREKAIQGHAEGFATKTLASGDECKKRGDALAEADKVDESIQAYGEAAKFFEDAAKEGTAAAQKALQTAQTARDNARGARQKAEQAKANERAGKPNYDKGRKDEQDGDAALDAQQLSSAVAFYNSATMAYQQAIVDVRDAQKAVNPLAVEAEESMKAMDEAKALCGAIAQPKQPDFGFAQKFEKMALDAFKRENFAKAKEYYVKAAGLYKKAAGK